ncbi:G-protein coupled receptor 84-like [Anguilla anguilla]|uniref:G-protein coupled receptors family 1 profile domain-containing protein n=1 Tax=Anguilla anguilla TaxID=7936 RepID=A0A9D3RPB3_ANGAN|nr:G-protein coupled receptor 84-like [Anguilla anguilla]KAG5837720.1 hypothetical protein ANANG_G00215550 [Anguilla anguilla]
MDIAFGKNGTATIIGVPVNTLLLSFNCLVLAFTFIVGVPGNLLVGLVVYRKKTLQTANNALLVNLATNDLLKCLLDTPVFFLSLLWGERHLDVGERLCCLQQFTYSLSSCVQILTLVIISVERFQAIAFPFETEKRKARIKVWMLLIWAFGLSLAILSVTLSKEALFYMMCRHIRVESRVHSDPFGTYVLIPVWGSSLALIIVHYLRIFAVVRQHTNKIFDNGIQFRSSVARHVSDWPTVTLSAPGTREIQPTTSASEITENPDHTGGSVNAASRTVSGDRKQSISSANKAPEIVGAICILTPIARELGKKRLEGKLAKRFGYIIIAFILFWVPMVVILLLNVIVENDANTACSRVLLELETCAMVVTCIPAALNPLLYTAVNHQFRTEFSKVLSTAWTCRHSPKS